MMSLTHDAFHAAAANAFAKMAEAQQQNIAIEAKARAAAQVQSALAQSQAEADDHYITYANHPETGELWVGTVEGVTRRTLMNLELGSDDDRHELNISGNRMTAIRVAALQAPMVLNQLMTAAARADDGDLDSFVDSITGRLGVSEQVWPTDPEAELSLIDYLMLLRSSVKKGEDEFFLRDKEMGGRVTGVSFRTQMMGPNYILIEFNATSVYGNNLVAVQGVTHHIGDVKLKDLPVIPMTQDTLARAAAAGKRRVELLTADRSRSGASHVKYDGVAVRPGFFGSRYPVMVSGRAVVDPEGCHQASPAMARALMSLAGIEYKYDENQNQKSDPVVIAQPTEFDYAAMVSEVVMFDINRSTWVLGAFSHMVQVKYRDNAFDVLVLDEARKRLVRAITTHQGQQGNIDLIDGKGGGAIFLLDGAPGTGKTLTAEATAETLHRVLYKVSLGELGTSIEQLEKALSQALAIAARWDAVLLIDEADVFLEKRSVENVHRNAMVAVFLRLLEYYAGILFLTTNRGDNLDEAFLSRVTLGLHYKRPDVTGMRKIWDGLLHNAGISSIGETEMDQLLSFDINGREIKNAINSSRALAAADGVPVSVEHILELLMAQHQFASDVKSATR